MNKVLAEYLWIDGTKPTAKLRSKMKVLEGSVRSVSDLPEWGFDGSSTNQAVTASSDCKLKPVKIVPDPIRGGDNVIALCEVFNPDGSAHKTNTRAPLTKLAEKYKDQEPWFGLEQEYTFFEGNQPLGWPDRGFPAPQGGYYCGVGADEVFGRSVVEEHIEACKVAGIELSGVNAEVMPAQWEFQVGPLSPLEVGDQLWLARWLLYRIGEFYEISASLHPKPVKGDWNGAGMHTNFSTKAMRENGGMNVITEAMKKLESRHHEHVAVYGAFNDERMTGQHETSTLDTFSYGESNRGASVRIPMDTVNNGKGYFEDRRPAANADPYEICTVMLETVCR